MDEEKRERIKMWMGWAMVIVALCIDAAQAILTAVGIGLVLGPIISAVAYFGYWVWFMILGVSFVKSPKKLGAMGGAAIVEIFLSFLPAFSAGVVAVVLMTMAEDKGGMIGKAAGMASGNVGVGSASRFSRISQVAQRFGPKGSTISEQDYGDEYTDGKRLEKLQGNQELLEKKKEKLETRGPKGGGESLRENDLVVPDDEIGRARRILEENAIPYKDRKYTERQVIDAKAGTVIPGEFVITIFNPEHPDKPASFDFVKRVLILLRSSGIVVRYGKNPERE